MPYLLVKRLLLIIRNRNLWLILKKILVTSRDNGLTPFPAKPLMVIRYMIDYLYYRFYRLWLHSSVSEGATFLAILLFSVMLSTNVLTAWGILTQYGIIDYPSDTQYYIIEGSLIALLCGRFFFKKRYRRIITKYEDENSVQRKVGVWALTVYIVATFICFFIEALHRQGKI